MAQDGNLDSQSYKFKFLSLAALVDLDREQRKLWEACRRAPRSLRPLSPPSPLMPPAGIAVPGPSPTPPRAPPGIAKAAPAKRTIPASPDRIKDCPDCPWSGPLSEYRSHRFTDHG